MTSHPSAGQAASEYVALLSLVGAALAAAGAAAGVSGVGVRVVQTVRTGICIVAGDVCRSSDAAAAGLAPCTLSERRRGGGGGATVLSIYLGDRREWSIARRSDGSVVVTRSQDSTAGVRSGVGVAVGPFGLKLGTLAGYEFTFASGSAWEFPDAVRARRFLAAMAHDPGVAVEPPTWRYGDVGSKLLAEAAASLGRFGITGEHGGGRAANDVAGIEASANAAAGVRTGRGRTTFYFRAAIEAPELRGMYGGGAALGRGAGPLLIEYTRDTRGPRELAFRIATPGRPGVATIVESVARLDLRDPVHRAAAARLLRLRAPWPSAVAADLRAVVLHAVRRGVVERSVYEVSDESSRFNVDARLGVAVGVELSRTKVDRRLVEATARTGGSQPRERVDCM